MGAMSAIGTFIGKVTLIVGFAGIGVLGLGLMGVAIALPGNVLWRIVVFVMGILAVLIAVGTAITAKNRPRAHTS